VYRTNSIDYSDKVNRVKMYHTYKTIREGSGLYPIPSVLKESTLMKTLEKLFLHIYKMSSSL